PPPPATATPPTSAPFTAASSSDVAAPNMIGDSFGPCSSFVAGSNFSSVAIPICIGASSFRVADNQSPLPQQRLYFNFSHFDDAIEIRKVQGNFGFPLTGETRKSLDVNRSLLGGEFLMLDGMASFQVQLPILNTIDSSTGPFVS